MPVNGFFMGFSVGDTGGSCGQCPQKQSQQNHTPQHVLKKVNGIDFYFNQVLDMFLGREDNIVHTLWVLMSGLNQG